MTSTRRRTPPWPLVAAVVAGLVGLAVVLAYLQGPGAVDDTASPGAVRSAVEGRPASPPPGRPLVRLAAVGDTGTGDAAELATVDEMRDESRDRPYDGLVLLGDLVYEVGDADLVDEVVLDAFAPITDMGTRLLPALGNHDYESGEQGEILTMLGRERSWYSTRIGPVRIIVLDSNRWQDEEQTRWLRRTLGQEQPRNGWTVVAMHHPAYSAGYHGSDLGLRERWSPLFARAGVELVLAGHDHDYQRSEPQDGVTYVVSGGGAKLRPTGHADFTAVSDSRLHFLDLLFYADRVVGRAIDQDGRLVDAFTIRH